LPVGSEPQFEPQFEFRFWQNFWQNKAEIEHWRRFALEKEERKQGDVSLVRLLFSLFPAFSNKPEQFPSARLGQFPTLAKRNWLHSQLAPLATVCPEGTKGKSGRPKRADECLCCGNAPIWPRELLCSLCGLGRFEWAQFALGPKGEQVHWFVCARPKVGQPLANFLSPSANDGPQFSFSLSLVQLVFSSASL